jgi:hypothetical protein
MVFMTHGRDVWAGFKQSVGRIIGRLDEHGKLVLVVDPSTLSPHTLRMFSGYDKEGNPLQKD